MLNTHGMKMTGIRKVAGATKGLTGYYSGRYIQVNYDPETGEVWHDDHVSFGQNSWTQYHDKNIINCGNISNPATMQEIADMVADAVNEEKYMKKLAEQHRECVLY